MICGARAEKQKHTVITQELLSALITAGEDVSGPHSGVSICPWQVECF